MNIVNIAYYYPERHETVREVAKRLDIPQGEALVLERIFGLQHLPIDPAATPESLMLSAAARCLDEAKVNRKKIKWVIHAHTANFVAPFGRNAIREVQQKLRLDNAIAFGMCMHKCSSVFVAFQVAREIFASTHEDFYIFIMTGEVSFTKELQYIPGTTITADGSCAILLSKNQGNNKLIQIETDIYGQFAAGIWEEKETTHIFEKEYNQLLANVIVKSVKHAGLTMGDIKIILPHNVNTISWSQVIKLLNISTDKVYLKNVAKTGHCFGSDPFINFRDACDEKIILPGDYYVLATVGLGATFAAMVLKN